MLTLYCFLTRVRLRRAARAVRGRHAERARGGGVQQPAAVGERRVLVVRRLRPEPQDRGGGPGPPQVALVVLAPGQLTAARRRRRQQRRRGLVRRQPRVVVAAAVLPVRRRRTAAHRRADLAPVPGLRLVRAREGPPGHGAEHAAVPAAGHPDEVRRGKLAVAARVPELHVEHAGVGGQGAVPERAQAAARARLLRRRRRRGSAEAGAAQRGGGRGVVPRQPERRRGHAARVRRRPGAGGVQLQGSRRWPHGPLVGGCRYRERPAGVLAEEVVTGDHRSASSIGNANKTTRALEE